MQPMVMLGEETSLTGLMFEDILEARIHGLTAGQMRFLRVRTIGDQVCISGAAPSYRARQLAEQAATSLVEKDRVQIEIEILPSSEWEEPLIGSTRI